jgi:hypothetical protein
MGEERSQLGDRGSNQRDIRGRRAMDKRVNLNRKDHRARRSRFAETAGKEGASARRHESEQKDDDNGDNEKKLTH